ncbi:MAG TPA: gliding motility protein GldC [Bacteroidia bacterium]|jgi:gliding motility-associated protein GldC|nr:gliding motility protein GldC [Bacteroidia bacterium]MBP7713296.1 gliding motility protein GldC [Bacteroidia bacterium]MBP8669050.1 gliding motility protein GldC [Bacteroidia bacterium]HNU48388.1 gliding motility protein GldC [Bacteroidia bacterium]HOZ82052.1 gliding motility protein GldC [Bacteroidia bacterium]
MKKSEIKFTVSLDDNNKPVALHWNAEDSGMQGDKECKAMMLALFDKKDQTTMRIDLWTQEMMVEEMQQFFFEMYMSMADTFQNATNNKDMADKMRNFARQFGKEVSLIK